VRGERAVLAQRGGQIVVGGGGARGGRHACGHDRIADGPAGGGGERLRRRQRARRVVDRLAAGGERALVLAARLVEQCLAPRRRAHRVVDLAADLLVAPLERASQIGRAHV